MRATKHLKSLRVRILLAITSLTILIAFVYSVFTWFIYDITDDRLFNWYILEQAKEAVAEGKLPEQNNNRFVVIGNENDLVKFVAKRYGLDNGKELKFDNVLRIENRVPYDDNYTIIDTDLVIDGKELQIVVSPWENEQMYLIYDISGYQHAESPTSLFTDRFVMLVLVPITLLIILVSLLYNAGLTQSILKPLTNLTKQVTGLKPQALTLKPITGNFYPDEVGELAKTFDRLIMKIEEHLQDEKYFSREVSHELRTPTTSLAMALELLEHTNLNEQQSNLLARMQRANNEMIQLINTFLWLAKNKAEFAPTQSVILHEQVSNVAAKLSHLTKGKPIKIINLVPICTTLMVNEDLLNIVLSNLLRNALQYTQKGSVTIEWQDQTLIITDTGLGIPKQEITRINEAFVSLHREGVGLGLSIVQRIIKKLGWHLQVLSKENQGTKVELIIRDSN